MTDPGDDDVLLNINFGDGSPAQTVGAADDGSFTLTHQFLQDGLFSVTVTATDDDGSSGATTFTATVINAAPVIDPLLSLSLNEGDTLSVPGAFGDPGADAWTATVDHGDGTGVTPLPIDPFTRSFTLTHAYTDDGSFTVSVSVTDGVGSGAATLAVSVLNLAPTVDLASDTAVDDSRRFTRSGVVSDVPTDTVSLTIDYGEVDGVEALAVGPGGTFNLDPTYAANDTYILTLVATDEDSGTLTQGLVAGIFIAAGGPPPELVSPPAATVSTDFDANFQALGVDTISPLIGPGGGVQWDLFPQVAWNVSGCACAFVTVAGQRIGAGVSAGTDGLLRLFGEFGMLNGTADIHYPADVTVDAPAVNSFLAGATVPVGSDWGLVPSGAGITATTSGDLALRFRNRLNAFVRPEFCLFGYSTPSFLSLNVGYDTGDVTLFSFNAAGNVLTPLPTFLLGFFGINPKFGPLAAAPTAVSVNPGTGVVTLAGTTTFSKLNIDLDQIGSRLAGAPPLGIDVGAARSVVPRTTSGSPSRFSTLTPTWSSSPIKR